jgi:isopentenyl diphosphate isomerase/L-lactate dehydrogenase-like FMN-dependent dehydrogenase
MGVGEELKDREVSASLVKGAEAAGCKAIVLTLDVPALGKRERDVRNPFTLLEHLSLKNLLPAGCQELPKNVASFASLFDATLTWERH